MRPQDIRFSQDSISSTFRNGTTLTDTISDLLNGSLEPTDFPVISVFWDDIEEAYFSLDNRRLYCFKEACSFIPVKIVKRPAIGLSTKNRGMTVRLRGTVLQRSPGFTQTREEGCWIFTHESAGWTLWYADKYGEYGSGYEYPENSKFVRDGKGGVWALCPTLGEKYFWRLWHVTAGAEENLFS